MMIMVMRMTIVIMMRRMTIVIMMMRRILVMIITFTSYQIDRFGIK